VADAFTDANIDRLDGLTVTYEDRWFNLRPSNTEPLLRLNIEADEAAAVDDLSMAVRTIAQGG
ncbi:MAG: phosphomannomutase/phosphoglucomutase, partial [Acidimicrobiia bacterium]